MRLMIFLPSLAFALASMAFATVTTFARDLYVHVGFLWREVMVAQIKFTPHPAPLSKPTRWIGLAARALNGRQVGGVRVHGFLGRPTVQMLAG
jgi:hypothetical protein